MKNVSILLLVWLIVFICVLPVEAQGTYVPTLYNTSNGLPQQTVNATIQDKQGYMWFATSNGFSRFDGEQFTNYSLEDSDSLGLGNNLITSLREDSRRYIWLTNDNRVTFRFNPYTRRFLQLPDSLGQVDTVQLIPNGDIWLYLKKRQLIRAYYDDKEELHYECVLRYPPNDTTRIVMISNDREGHVWILTSKELLDYDHTVKKLTRHPFDADAHYFSMRKRLNLFQVGGDRGRVFIYHNKEGYHTLIQLPTEDNVVRIKAYTDVKSIYMTAADGFFLHDIETGAVTQYAASCPAPYKLESNRIGDCYVDQDKNIWVTYLDNSVITCLEIAKNSQRKFHLLDRHRQIIAAHDKISIFEDRNQRIWFYAPNKALNYYDMENHELFPLILPSTQNMPDFTEPSNLYVDKQRNLWLGKGNKGVLKLTFKSNYFKLVSPDPSDLYNNENRVISLCIDRHDRLWMGTRDSTIHIFDARTHRFLGYFSDRGVVTPHKTYMGQANTIMEDHEGNVWIGTEERGLFKATPQGADRYVLQHFMHREEDPCSLSDNRVTVVLEDSVHHIWVGTSRGGLNYVSCDSQGRTVFFHRGNRLKQYPATHREIRCLCEDSRGYVWVASKQGVLRFHPLTNAPESLVFEDLHRLTTGEEAFNSNAVLHIFRDSRGTLYLATFGKGLYRSDGHHFKNYTTRDGLPSDIIYTMQEDARGHIWLATEVGLCEFDLEAETFDTFDNRFFPSDLTFSDDDAVANCPTGELLFATDRGFLAFRPADIEKEIYEPNIVLTSFAVNDSLLTGKEGLPFRFDNEETVVLEHEHNSFSLRFRALDMNFPDRVQYAFKLEGFDDWHYVGNDEKAVYTNIPTGTYTFRVRSTNSDGRWVDNERTLRIRVLPSFRESPCGIALFTALFLLAVFVATAIVLKLYKLNQRVEMEQKLADVKTNFFTNIVHEMRTPFTLIVSPLENVLGQTDLSPKVRQNLEVMQTNVRRSIRLINQILDFQKITSDKMHLRVQRVELRSFFEQLLASFSGLAEREHTSLALQMEAPSLTVWADEEKLESVFFNLLSNAFKYSPRGKQITVEVTEGAESVVVRVADQGYGIPEDKQSHLFGRFESFLQKSASRTPSTGIGLSLIKELVELHHGHITVSSKVGEGSVFTVELPKGKSHFPADTEFIVDDGDSALPADAAPATDYPAGDHRPLLLLVEDNADLRRFLESTFAADYRVATASNGEEGFLQAVKRNPDLVISDVRMPLVSGTEMVKMLRSNPATSHIPVVLLTGEATFDGEIESLNLDVEAYISKPFSSKVLQAQVSNILRRREQLRGFYQSQFTRPDTAALAKEQPDEALPSAEQEFIRRLTDYISEQLGSPELTVESLARRMNVSRSVLTKKTKALIGISPVELIRDFRLRRAVALLEAGGRTITEVAFLTGFYDSHYFSKCFKQVYGVSPSDYCKKK